MLTIVPAAKAKAMLEEIAKYGTPTFKRIYADNLFENTPYGVFKVFFLSNKSSMYILNAWVFLSPILLDDLMTVVFRNSNNHVSINMLRTKG